jgi:hypothetical protein
MDEWTCLLGFLFIVIFILWVSASENPKRKYHQTSPIWIIEINENDYNEEYKWSLMDPDGHVKDSSGDAYEIIPGSPPSIQLPSNPKTGQWKLHIQGKARYGGEGQPQVYTVNVEKVPSFSFDSAAFSDTSISNNGRKIQIKNWSIRNIKANHRQGRKALHLKVRVGHGDARGMHHVYKLNKVVARIGKFTINMTPKNKNGSEDEVGYYALQVS